ncbi:uncharacterized protein VTP21DRAFT_11567 [Calcarisporiella thermophila]|uniref:uncharacterized protein n=1 Tax=Calcarisporiella thermophila TaxID=911321 RepID=UPI003743A72E
MTEPLGEGFAEKVDRAIQEEIEEDLNQELSDNELSGSERHPANDKQKKKKKKKVPMPESAPKYMRGQPQSLKDIKDKKLKGNLKRLEKRYRDAAYKAASSELLLTEEAGYLEAEGMERTYKFTQRELVENLDINSAGKYFNLKLDTFGPYSLDYTRNGRHLAIAGRKGHIATFDWQSGRLGCELHLKETARDIKWLHNETLFAVAQKKYTYIYDHTGLEVHCLKKHIEVNRLEFLPYHFLLVSVGNAGYLKYQDTSTGQLVAELRTKLGRCDAMTQNPYNAIINLGHANGTVTMWSPTMSEPLVKMLCHKGPVLSLAVDNGGRYLATSGLDGRLKIWDIRTYKPLQDYYIPTPAQSLSISQRGLLGVGWGPHVSVWKDAFVSKQPGPYMTHLQPSTQIQDLHFCPYEDALGFGHSGGITSIVVPGAGEPNFDALEANPFQNKKQRQEAEVHSLLDKIQPEMIMLDPNFIGTLHRDRPASRQKGEAEEEKPKEKLEIRSRTRGKNSSLRRYLRKKQKNVIDAKKMMVQERLQKEKEERQKRVRGEMEKDDKPFTALDRFTKKQKA